MPVCAAPLVWCKLKFDMIFCSTFCLPPPPPRSRLLPPVSSFSLLLLHAETSQTRTPLNRQAHRAAARARAIHIKNEIHNEFAVLLKKIGTCCTATTRSASASVSPKRWNAVLAVFGHGVIRTHDTATCIVAGCYATADSLAHIQSLAVCVLASRLSGVRPLTA